MTTAAASKGRNARSTKSAPVHAPVAVARNPSLRAKARFEAADFADDFGDHEEDHDSDGDNEGGIPARKVAGPSSSRRVRKDPEDSSTDSGDEQEDEDSLQSDVSEVEDVECRDEDADDSDRERDAHLRRLRRELKRVPLGELADIQRKVGVKAFKGAAAQGRFTETAEGSDFEDEEELAEPAEFEQNGKRTRTDQEKDGGRKRNKIIPKRVGKNRPVEITAKRPVGRFRQVVELKTPKRRDPRFDAMSGRFNADAFAKSYSFLEDYRKSEKTELKKRMITEKNPEEREKFRMTLMRMEAQANARKLKEKAQEIKREYRKREAELVKAGKTPYFLKRSDQKKLLNVAFQ